MDSFEVWGIVLPGHRADDAGVCRVVTWRSPYGAADARFTKCGLDLPVGIFGVRALLPLTFAAHVHATRTANGSEHQRRLPGRHTRNAQRN
ncbi:hypothetical protein Srufu_013650 [Streptomyces libani subsp. rufus]|nr:hypothetical protein Srufu_013650 [Streptomyces libani subsp. rufus]